MKTVAIQLADEVYGNAERRASERGAALVGEIADLVKRYGENSKGVVESPETNGESSTAERFHELAREWREATAFISSSTDIVLHASYQQIIGMGPPALPHIFAEMRRQPGQWFWALKAITGEDPVAPADRAKIRRMTETWLEWANDRGF